MFALQAFCLLIYLIFYPITKWTKTLEIIYYGSLVVLVHYLVLILLVYEFYSPLWVHGILAINLLICLCLLVFIDLALSKYIVLALVLVELSVILLYDYIVLSDENQKNLFYYSLLMEIAFIAIALVFFIFRLPERCCPETRYI